MQKIKLIVLSSLVLLFLSCAKEPNEVGAGLIPESELFNVKVFDSDSAVINVEVKNVLNFVNSSASNILLVGNYDDISSGAMIRFDIPDTLRNYGIEKAWLKLYKGNVIFGDSTKPVSFTIHKVVSDLLNSSSFYDEEVIGSFNGVPDSVNFIDIDTSVVRFWFNGGKNHGIYLKPTNDGVIRSFNSLDEMLFVPTLEVKVRKGDKIDTVQFFYGSDGYFAELKSPVGSDSVVLQAGVGLRSILKFDISSFPKDAIVNRAEIILYLKGKKTYGVPGADSITASFITDTSLVVKSLGGFETNYYLGKRDPLDTTIYVIPVTSIVQRWVKGEANNGVLLMCYLEGGNFDRFVFHYRERKPRLKIYYTIKPGS